MSVRARPRLGAWVVAWLALACAGCSTARIDAAFARFAAAGNLDDPRAGVDEGIDGGRVTLRQGAALVVRLPAFDQDHRWDVVAIGDPNVVSALRLDFVPAAGPAMLPRVPPYSLWLAHHNPPQPDAAAARSTPEEASGTVALVERGEALLRLRAREVGTSGVELAYRRTDDTASAAAKRVRFDVDVIR